MFQPSDHAANFQYSSSYKYNGSPCEATRQLYAVSHVMMYPTLFPIFATFVLGTHTIVSELQCPNEATLFTYNQQCFQRTESISAEDLEDPVAPTAGPWSYPPICTERLPSVGSKLCVYTNTSFSRGRGISIFTTPELAEEFAALPPFQNSDALESINQYSGAWYTQQMPGKGMGMLAKKDLKFKDRITSYTPAFLAYLESDLSTAVRERFYETAVSQLPGATREKYLNLATVYGIPEVKHQDVVKANTFQLEVGGHNHLAVFPETSRLNHACAPK